MNMKWSQRVISAVGVEWSLILAGLVMATAKLEDGNRRWYLYGHGVDSSWHDTREAAMQAAEQAVREWLGKAVAEVMEPVAWLLHGGKMFHPTADVRRSNLELALKTVNDGSVITPLFALPEVKP